SRNERICSQFDKTEVVSLIRPDLEAAAMIVPRVALDTPNFYVPTVHKKVRAKISRPGLARERQLRLVGVRDSQFDQPVGYHRFVCRFDLDTIVAGIGHGAVESWTTQR